VTNYDLALWIEGTYQDVTVSIEAATPERAKLAIQPFLKDDVKVEVRPSSHNRETS
jgi:hypothetical protein